MNIPSDQPLVSVCIPTYNRAGRLAHAIRTSLASTYTNIEVIVSDNASTDTTREVCEAFSRVDKRFRSVHHTENLGATWNFEYVRHQAKGEYFIWLGDDDHMDPDLIERCVKALEADDSLVLAAGVGAYHRGDGETVCTGNVIQPLSKYPLLRVLSYVFRMEDNSIFCGLYRRERVAQCAPPNVFTGDSIWMGQILLEGRAIVLEDVQLHRELWNSGSASPKKMVSSVGGPAWQGRFPCIAVPLNVARGIAFGAPRMRRRGALIRYAVATLIFATSLLKQFILLAAPKIPGGRAIYQWYFKSDIDKIPKAMLIPAKQ